MIDSMLTPAPSPKPQPTSLRSTYVKLLTPETLSEAERKSGRVLSFHRTGLVSDLKNKQQPGLMNMQMATIDYAKIEERYAQYWLEHPIHCGFLLAFSVSQYNSENVKFLMALINFKDHLAVETTAFAKDSWREIDHRLDIDRQTRDEDLDLISWDHVIDSKLWTSTRLQLQSVVRHVQTIWDEYFSPTAASEICISAKMRARTVFRLRHLYVYGKAVFDEAMADPLKTVNKDVLPRFLVSGYYNDLMARLASITPLPSGEALSVTPPQSSFVLKLDMDITSLDDLKKTPWRCDFILYEAFQQYLISIVANEQLLCVRAIANYQQLWADQRNDPATNDLPAGADTLAWNIYAHFVARGSANEVSVSDRRRKQIMTQLASPSEDMFDRIQEQTYGSIGHLLDPFYRSTFFTKLPEVIREEQRLERSRSTLLKKKPVPKGKCIVFL